MHGMSARRPVRADARADRADRPFFPRCNAFVTGRNVIRPAPRVSVRSEEIQE